MRNSKTTVDEYMIFCHFGKGPTYNVRIIREKCNNIYADWRPTKTALR